MTDHTHSQYVEGCFRCDLSRDEVASGYITEAIIDHAAKALWDEPGWDRASHEQRQHHREAAERALSAVVPAIVQAAKVDAWDEGHASGCADPYAKYGECDCGPNPYRERGES